MPFNAFVYNVEILSASTHSQNAEVKRRLVHYFEVCPNFSVFHILQDVLWGQFACSTFVTLTLKMF